jgi:hypothetical protein
MVAPGVSRVRPVSGLLPLFFMLIKPLSMMVFPLRWEKVVLNRQNAFSDKTVSTVTFY